MYNAYSIVTSLDLAGCNMDKDPERIRGED